MWNNILYIVGGAVAGLLLAAGILLWTAWDIARFLNKYDREK